MENFASGSNKIIIMNILTIDTSGNKVIRVGLKKGNIKDVLEEKIKVHKAQSTLPLIDKLLKKHELRAKDINHIEVNTGPGSFTGIRVGMAIANALSFALKIPVKPREMRRSRV